MKHFQIIYYLCQRRLIFLVNLKNIVLNSKKNTDIDLSKIKYFDFVQACEVESFYYKLTLDSPTSPFSRCFAIFGLNLINQLNLSVDSKIRIGRLVRSDLDKLHQHRKKLGVDVLTDKPYLQLLSFSLSALSLLGILEKDPLGDHCLNMIPDNVIKSLDVKKVSSGVPQSGNYAMFLAIILIHARKYLNLDSSSKIDEWCDYHIKHMNRFGFWGNDSSMSHLQFQNGYHQYEIFHYLGIENPKINIAADAISKLADRKGRFAPYPGGGGCYDYDAVSIITSAGSNSISIHRALLENTLSSILEDQNLDGGFCESRSIRPRSLKNSFLALDHILLAKGKAKIERMRQAVTLQRSKHDKIKGAEHWTDGKYCREWNESNLWDSYFRLLVIATIDLTLHPKSASDWRFIDYPGIGYHQSLKGLKG